MCEHRDFNAAASGRISRCEFTQKRRQDAPIDVQDWKRNQDNYQSHALRQLPARSFQLPRKDQNERKRHG